MLNRCRRCNEEIPRVVDECPECGYAPGAVARDVAAVLVAFGVVLLVVFPPFGVLLFVSGVLLLGWSVLATPSG